MATEVTHKSNLSVPLLPLGDLSIIPPLLESQTPEHKKSITVLILFQLYIQYYTHQ